MSQVIIAVALGSLFCSLYTFILPAWDWFFYNRRVGRGSRTTVRSLSLQNRREEQGQRDDQQKNMPVHPA